MVHKHGISRVYQYSTFVVDNEHANQGSQCSFVPTYTMVAQSIALYRLGGAREHVLYQFFFDSVECSVVILIACLSVSTLKTEPFDVQVGQFAYRSIRTISRSSLMVKV